MIKITQLKIPVDGKPDQTACIRREIARILKIREEEIKEFEICKKSIDARKKDQIHYSYVVTVKLAKGQEERILKRSHHPSVQKFEEVRYELPETGEEALNKRPVIAGSGPAGLFCAWLLALKGFRPIVLERGSSVEKRTEAVKHFWETGELSERTNVQFGEGGAGTFSDGKLNTMVKDTYGRIRYVLEGFVQFGADPEILYWNKPHIGTDVLRDVVRNMREEIKALGGEFRFETKLSELLIRDGGLAGIRVEKENGTEEEQDADILVLAIGHSARDTFHMLAQTPLQMEAKAFAAGVRVEHRQEMIGMSQYGESFRKLPTADYKVTHTCENGRGIYSFCMCPGGFVVNASSEKKRLVVNGMSDHARDGRNANSALIVTVTPEDFGTGDPLSGIEFQRRLEEAAYSLAGGKIPVQLYGDFKENRISTGFGSIVPDSRGETAFGNLREILPEWMSESLIEGMKAFGRKIEGFDMEDAVFSGVETRTSSPVRMMRKDGVLEAEGIEGVYPCGEGAGYAGGIMSAAVDGMKVAEAIIRKFRLVTD